MNPYYPVPGYFRGQQPMPHVPPPSPRNPLNRAAGLQPQAALQQHFMQEQLARIQHQHQVHRAMAQMAYNRSADLADQDHIGLPHRSRSPKMEEDKESIHGLNNYNYSPLGSPSRGDEAPAEGTFRPDIGLTDKDLIDIETKDLNKKLKKANVSKERAKAIKAERRTLKNRGYASSCRIKREKEVERLEEEIRLQKNDVTVYDEEIKEIIRRTKDLEEWHRKMDYCMRAFETTASKPSSPDAGYYSVESYTPPEHKDEAAEAEGIKGVADIKDEDMEEDQEDFNE